MNQIQILIQIQINNLEYNYIKLHKIYYMIIIPIPIQI
jgi:hypothetical protein